MGCCYPSKVTLKDAPLNNPVFKLSPTSVKISRLIDGDTFEGVIVVNNSYHNTRFRLYGYDAHELHPRGLTGKEKEDELKYAQRDLEALSQYLKVGEIYNITIPKENDKYGRNLCTIYTHDNKDVCQLLLSGGYGFKYDGGNKMKAREVS